jgi:hypothetical protein
VAGEFRRTFEEQRFGLPFEESLTALADRVPLVDVRIFVTALLIQREVGGNLAEILDNLSDIIRQRFTLAAAGAGAHRRGPDEHVRADGDALRVGGFVFMSNPEYVMTLFSTRSAGSWSAARCSCRWSGSCGCGRSPTSSSEIGTMVYLIALLCSPAPWAW